MLIYGGYRYYISRQIHFVFYPAFGITIPDGYSIHGMDISKYQSDIDWQKVSQVHQGNVRINFVFIKATEGITQQDNLFEKNWKNARRAGIVRGAYHFFYSTRDPLLQAKNFERMVHLRAGDLPPVLDMEVTNDQPGEVIREKSRIWLEEIQRHYGVTPIIYTNLKFYEKYLGDDFDQYPLWISHFNEESQPPTLRKWVFWQHSKSGHVAGIKSTVDFNVFKGDSIAFNKILLH